MRYEVPPEASGLSLGKFLYNRLKLSRTLVRRAKNEGAILVDGRPARVDHVLRGGEHVELVVESRSRVEPEPVPIAVVYEDGELLVADKPPGMVVHPVKDYQQGTLAGGVAYHLLQRGEEPVARPVQRIDRETSGLVLFAKNPAVAGGLARELEKHKLERRYIAFVHGEPAAEQGTVDVPLRRVWGHPVAREVALGPRTPEQEALLAEAEARGEVLREEWKATGQRAVTHWRVLRRWPGVTMLALQLETGRTHQIRVHMTYLGHPLLGDSLYGSGGRPGRQALHAGTLVFGHPVTGAELRLEAPLPSDLERLVAELEGGVTAMHEFNLEEAVAVLERTPAGLGALLRDLPENWVQATEGEGTWSPYDVIGHLIQGERTDWIPRARHILSGETGPFKPFDRTAQFTESQGKSLGELLATFAELRRENLAALKGMNLTSSDLGRKGQHPALGEVTLAQLLATWVVHDLDHVGQVVRTMAKAYAGAVGPWSAYLSILHDRK